MPDVKKQINWSRIHADYLSGMPVADICKLHGCGRSEFYKRSKAGNWAARRDAIADEVDGGVEERVLTKLKRLSTLTLDTHLDALEDWAIRRSTLLATTWDAEQGPCNPLLHSLLPATLGKAMGSADAYIKAIVEAQAIKAPAEAIELNINVMPGSSTKDPA